MDGSKARRTFTPASVNPGFFPGRAIAWVIAPVVVIGSVTFLVIFGLVGLARSEPHIAKDLSYLVAAGRCWMHGADPYDVHTIRETIFALPGHAGSGGSFAYPPHIAPLCVILSLFEYTAARIAMTVLNLAALAALVVFSVHMLKDAYESSPPLRWLCARWMLASLIIGNPFTAHVVWMGQTSLLATASLVAAWQMDRCKRPIAAGVLLAVASMKPQLVLLPILWWGLQRNVKPLAVAALTVIIMSAIPLLSTGVTTTVIGWVEAMEYYREAPVSAAGFRHVFGIQSASAAMGLQIPNLIPLAILLTVLLWWFRARIRSDTVLGILAAGSVLLVYAHDYDLVVLAPLALAFWRYLERRWFAVSCAGILAIALFIPQRLVRTLDVSVLWHWRTAIVAVLLAWLVHMSYMPDPHRSTA